MNIHIVGIRYVTLAPLIENLFSEGSFRVRILKLVLRNGTIIGKKKKLENSKLVVPGNVAVGIVSIISRSKLVMFARLNFKDVLPGAFTHKNVINYYYQSFAQTHSDTVLQRRCKRRRNEVHTIILNTRVIIQ